MLLWVLLMVLAGFGWPRQTRGAAEQNPPTAANEITVALQEIPVWEVANERVRSSFLRGQYTFVRPLQKGMVLPGKRPQFTSDTPLCGEVSFPGVVRGPGRSDRLVFALDSSQKGGDYDLLYFDDDRDGDLTNDKARKPTPPPERLGRRSASYKEVYFEPVQVAFNFGGSGSRSLELLPYLQVYQGDSTPQFSFIAARVHTGEFEIRGTTYRAFVGYQYMIQGPLDQPSTTLILAPQDGEPAYWWGGDQLRTTHLLGGRYWRFSCTPAGDRLTVRPYDGPLGTLEVGPGERKVEKVQIRGSLRSKETAVMVGDGLERGWPKPTRQCRLPVGDYYPAIVDVVLGNLDISVSNNYHTNAQGQSRNGREPVAGIQIRADKPYVLDFSNKPAVVFTEPIGAAEREFPRGNDILVKAVLLDPVLDIMIRGLTDTTRNQTQTYKTADGKEQTYTRPLSLDPKVTIARTNGEIVAEGTMPFG